MSYRALYRKYRPKLFRDIVGQPGIVQALTGQVAAGRISHAYLFSGPRGTGKTSAAKVLARAINCMDNHAGEACGVCRPCVELLTEANMDVVEIDAASNNSVDKVREMLDNVKYMPALGKFRVYIVDEVHMLSTSAFNALLKTLEEPPAHVVFILATTEPHKLPPTVLSRCQQFQFRRIGTAAMTSLLEGVLESEGASADKEALQAIARAADGGMRDALSLLDQCLSLNAGAVTARQVQEMLGTSDSTYYFAVAERLLMGDAGGAVDLIDQFINSGGEVKTFAADLCRHMRDLFIAAYVKDPSGILDVSQEEAARFAVQAGGFAPGDMLKCLGILSELEGSLRYAANPRVLVELAMFRCCRVEKEASYEALLGRVERLEARLESGALPARATTAQTAPTPADETLAQPVNQPPASSLAHAVSQTPASVPTRPAPKPAAFDAPPWDEPAPRKAEPATPSRVAPAPEPEPDWQPPAEPPPERDEMPAPSFRVPAQEPPRPVPQPAHNAEAAPRPAGASVQATRLWNTAVAQLPNTLQGFAKKGKATSFEGGELVVTYTEDDKNAADMLADARRMTRLNEVVDGIAGSHVEIRLEVSRWSPAQQQFIERSRALVPKDAAFIIEKED